MSSKLVLAVLLVALLPFFGLCFYNQPYLDDYAWATLFRERGWWAAQTYLYQTQNGRFVASLCLTALNPLSYGGPGSLGLASLLLNLGTFFTLWLGLHSCLGQSVSQLVKLLLASILLLIFIAIIPDIYSSCYWFASQVTHHMASLFLVLVPVSVARLHHAPRRASKLGWWGLAAFGSGLTGGSSELVTVLLGWLLLVAGGLSLHRRAYRSAGVWASLLLVLAGAALLDGLAPGSLARLHPASQGVGGVAARLAQLWQPAWLCKALWLLLARPGTLLVLVAPLLLQPLGPALLARRPVGLRLPLLVGGSVVLGGVVLGAALMQVEVTTPQITSRCANVLLWWLLLGWLAACWAALPPGAAPRGRAYPALRLAGLGLLCLLVVPTVLRAWRELLVDAPRWNRQCQQRYAWLRVVARHEPHTNVQLLPIRHVRPSYVLIRGYDIATAYNQPYNLDLARYFGVDSVRVNPLVPGAAF